MLSNQAKKVCGLRHSWQISVSDAAAVRRQVADDDLIFGRNAFKSNCNAQINIFKVLFSIKCWSLKASKSFKLCCLFLFYSITIF